MSPPPARGSSDRSRSPAPVEWRYDPTTVRWLRLVAAVRTALVGTATAVALAVLGALLALAFLLVDGSFGLDRVAGVLLVFAIAVFVIARSPAAILALSRAERERLVAAGVGYWPFSRREQFALGALGASVVAVCAWLWLPSVLLVAGVGVGAAFLTNGVSTVGRLDPEQYAYSVPAGGERSFAAATRYDRRRLGPLVLFRLRYPRRPGSLSKPRRILVPAPRADEAAAVFDAAVADTTTEDGGHAPRESNRQVRLVGGTMGVGILVGCVAAVVFLDGVLGWYLAAVGGVFGALLLFVTVVEG